MSKQTGVLLALLILGPCNVIVAAEPLIVTADMQLDPARSYGAIVIKASGIVIDGHDATLQGSGGDDPSRFQGIAITAKGVNDVTIRNIKARGWETALNLVDGANWTIEDCDFSENFHDPAFGWGENGRRGGIVLDRVRESRIVRCRAQRVWDACVLINSDGNRLSRNDFSHTSNTCLKLWNSSRNVIENNDLSHGIRKDPGEVHARDSACVLIESGSNDNRLVENDCRYGGDGIFVRVLNGWVSTGNHFEANDCSHANNNGVEAWSPGNIWTRNRSNHCSYGFWLGASDKNVLIDNEASFNGLADGNHNSPHLPMAGHAGIVFMFGPSSHTVLRGNRCEGNQGAGIAAIGDLESHGKAWNAFHWIVEQNHLHANRWGIYLQNAEMLDLASNEFSRNTAADVFDAGNVTALTVHDGHPEIVKPPVARLEGPAVVALGTTATFDASGSSDPAGQPLAWNWRMQPEGHFEGPVWMRTFDRPGFFRIALTVNNGRFSDLAWRDLYVVGTAPESGTDHAAAQWEAIDPDSTVQFHDDPMHKLIGESSTRAEVRPYGGGRVVLRCRLNPRPILDAAGPHVVSFWLKTQNQNIPGWQDVNPIVAISDGQGEPLRLVPKRDLLSIRPYLEAREGWTYFEVPLQGDDTWTAQGPMPASISQVDLGFDSWDAEPLVLWIDGLSIR